MFIMMTMGIPEMDPKQKAAKKRPGKTTESTNRLCRLGQYSLRYNKNTCIRGASIRRLKLPAGGSATVQVLCDVRPTMAEVFM